MNLSELLKKNAEGRVITEVMIDSSGSVSDKIIKNILRQIVPIYENSDYIRIAFFDNEFHGWQEIKSKEELLNLKIIGRGGTDLVKSTKNFTYGSNKIVFTDGVDYYFEEAVKENPHLKTINWLVFDTKSTLEIEGGKVFNIDIYADSIFEDEKVDSKVVDLEKVGMFIKNESDFVQLIKNFDKVGYYIVPAREIKEAEKEGNFNDDGIEKE